MTRVRQKSQYQRGIEAAAAFVSEWDKYVDHEWRLSGCILGKFNMLPKRKLRRNRSDRVGIIKRITRELETMLKGRARERAKTKPDWALLNHYDQAIAMLLKIAPALKTSSVFTTQEGRDWLRIDAWFRGKR